MSSEVTNVIIFALLAVIVALVALQVGARIERRKSQPKPTVSRLEATAAQATPNLYESAPRRRLPIFSAREWEIAQLAAQGKTNKEIADLVNISQNTVGTHIKKIYRKLEISNRAELAQRLQHLAGDPNPPLI